MGYNRRIAGCFNRYYALWLKAEDAAGPGVCPTEGDLYTNAVFLGTCAQDAENALAGAPLPLDERTCNQELQTRTSELTECNSGLAQCSSDCVASLRPPLRSGQTTCYDTAGAVIDCAGTGQDGEFQKGAARSFTDNGDGTISDATTGLVWEKLSNDGSIHDWKNQYSWNDAFAVKIFTLNASAFGGHSDWRLPNLTEMMTMLDWEVSSPATFSAFWDGCEAGCSITTCSCTLPGRFWTSTTDNYNPSAAWEVDFQLGEMAWDFKTNPYPAVRAVRGGP